LPLLRQLIAIVPYHIHTILTDNGPELTALAVADWAEEHGVELEFIKPGRPMQNGFIERFNRSYREAVLNMYIFETLKDVKTETKKWLGVYNRERPHERRAIFRR
jgi:putative transposase